MPKRTNDGLRKRCTHARKSWPDCKCAWWFSFFYAEREYRYSLTKLARARGEEPPVSKDQATTWRDRLRAEIRSGTFIDPDTPPPPAPTDVRLTFGDVCDQYLERFVRTPTRRPGGRAMMELLVRLSREAEIPAAQGTTMRLEGKPFADVTKADIDAVRAWRRAQTKGGAKGGEAGINRVLARLRHVFNWALVEGYREDTPFKRGSATLVKLNREAEAARTRRLDAAGEADRLLAAASPFLRAVLTAALTTGCRIGELLSLQWGQVRTDAQGEAAWLLLPATKTKTGEARTLPVGSRLRAELAMRRQAPDGQALPASAFVFGTETGEPVSDSAVRKAWEDAVIRAHGAEPTRARGTLTPEARAAYKAAGLHLHDLRREFASQLLESDARLHDVQLFLGHANITTTSRYLQSTPTRLARVLRTLESGVFAHDSHTGAETGENTAPTATGAAAANSLN